MKYKFLAFVCFISVILSVIAVSPWLFENKILYFWDSYLPFDPKISFEHIFYTWREGLFPGYASVSWSWLPYWGLFFLPYIFTQSLPLSEGFVYILLLSFSIVNFYLLTTHVLSNILKKKDSLTVHLSTLIVGILYAFNIYTFFNFYFMFNPGAFILAFLPLNVLALVHIYPLEQNVYYKKSKIWLGVFIVSLIGMVSSFSVYVFFLQYLIWISFYLAMFWLISKKKLFSFFTLELIVFLLLIIFINLWWFFPAFFGFSIQYNAQSSFGTTEWFDKGFKPSQLLHALRLMGSGLMINNKFTWSTFYEQNVIFTFPLFVFPFLFIVSLAYAKKKVVPFLVFLLGMTLISLFIVKFSNPPYAWILGLGYHYIPFFGGFRDAFQKAGIYFSFGYFIFIAIGLVEVINYLNKNHKVNTFLFAFLFLIGCVVLSGPFFLFGNNNIRKIQFLFQNKKYEFSAKTQVPKEYYSLKENIEKKCKGETIMLIPRSGYVTDGVWTKYNMSYVGQDILPSLINCNFLSTAMFNYYAESSIRAPYLQLQSKDFESFKAYMAQNGIRFAMVRKDFLPQGFITWIYVDPYGVEQQLVEDSDFTKIYENDFFTLFEKRNQLPKQYGFKLTKDVVQFQSDIKSGIDFATATRVIGNINQPVIPNSSEERIKYQKDTTIFASIANCIGCISLEGNVIPREKFNLFNEVKKTVKSFIKKEGFDAPLEITISKNVVLGDKLISELVRAIDTKNQKKFNNLLIQYRNHWMEIEKLVSMYKVNRFLQNNKKMEVVNFLSRERNTVYAHFVSGYLEKGKFLNKKENRGKMLSLLSFQQEMVRRFNSSIFQTSFIDKIFKMRLDIPKSGAYTCFVNNLNNSLSINSISIDGKDVSDVVNYKKTATPLKKGSYLVSIFYQALKLLRVSKIVLNSGQTKEIKIGKLEQGAYKLSLNLGNASNGRALVVVSRGRKSDGIFQSIDSIEDPGRNVILLDQINKDSGSIYNYTRIIEVDLPSNENYYAYIFHLGFKNTPLTVLDFELSRAVKMDDVQFACSLNDQLANENQELLTVIQESPVLYKIAIPANYKGFLAFNQTFDSNWVAHEKDGRVELPHFISGYANAWHIDNLKKHEIIVEYKTQTFAIKSAIATGLAAVVILLIYIKIRGK